MPENEERSSLSERRQRRRSRRKEMLRQAGDPSATTLESSAPAPVAVAAEPTRSPGKVTATPGRRTADQPGFLSNFILFRPVVRFWLYLQDVGAEIRKVSWPTRADARRLTRIVLIVTIAAAICLGLASFGLSELFRYGIETPLILLGTFALIVGGTLYRMRRNARSTSYG
ncbi:MAG: preprotein translocase subunit SecE [Anaerolineaceae bacterium]|nr:preprotein translocase subunit SecE [Anaerolineaceae bacterium]MCY3934550.1 preprotein translocase subunit SecE [Chloroflexota bacterium]MCY4008703.1 preprotein translocase subunit SecE [Anaerolineaceae bacterium]MCY4107320.1 preprotein translocase subunit SecE [Chloroflexota bacterium]